MQRPYKIYYQNVPLIVDDWKKIYSCTQIEKKNTHHHSKARSLYSDSKTHYRIFDQKLK